MKQNYGFTHTSLPVEDSSPFSPYKSYKTLEYSSLSTEIYQTGHN